MPNIRLHLTAPHGLRSHSVHAELPVVACTPDAKTDSALRFNSPTVRVSDIHVWAQFVTARSDARRRR
jgi:hypothetical protein